MSTPMTRVTRSHVLRRAGLAAGGAAALALAACGSATTATSGTAAKTPVRLTMYNQGGSQQIVSEWTETLKLVEQKLPHITYDIGGPEQNLQFVEKATALWAGGTPPDFTYSVTRNGPAIFTGGMTYDMNVIARREKIDLAGVAKNVLDDFSWDGKLMALPVDTGYAYIQYNKSLFEKAGQPDPGTLWTQGKWDWDTFVSTSVAMGRAVGEGGAAFTIRTWEVDYLSILRTHGGELLNADRTKLALEESGSVTGLTRWAELHTRQQASTAVDKQPQGGFRSGLMAMVSSHPGEIVPNQRGLKDAGATWTWDVVPHPVPRGGKRTPTLFTNGPKSYVKLHQELTPQVKGLPHTTNYLEWHGIVAREILTPVGTGQKSPQDAARAAAPAINALLARGKGT